MEEPGQTVEARQCQITGNRQDLDQAFALAIFRNECKAAPDTTGRVSLLHFLAIDIDLARGMTVLAHHTFEKLGTSSPHKAVDSKNFTCADG